MRRLDPLAALLSCFLVLWAPSCSGEVKPETWRADLRDLERQLVERHVDLYHSISREAFEKAVSELDRRIPSLTTPEILVGFAQLVAMVGDGHTSFYPGNQKKWKFRYYPIKLWSFSDGVYVIATTPEHVDLFGKRLRQIDDTPIEEAFRRVSTTVGADNDMEYQYTVPFELVRPEMLHALSIIRSPQQAEFVFEGGDRRTLRAMTEKKWLAQDWRSANSLYQGDKPPSMRLEFLFATPLTVEHLKQRKYYWFTHLEAERTLYFQFNICWDQKNRPTFQQVAEELFKKLDHGAVERVIVDLRQNTGGEPKVAKPLIDGLARRSELGKAGRLFVLVGRRTFSAALTNAAQLRSRAGATIVGEPPRGKPNNPSEGRDIDLKRTKLWVTVSTQFVERDPTLGDADYLPVDIPVASTFDQYRNAQDPVLAAALAAAVSR